MARQKKRASREVGLRNRLRNFVLQRCVMPFRIEHVSGPRRVRYQEDELIAVCLAKDAEVHIVAFIEHHLKLGVKHIVVLDNDSADATIELASTFPQVTVLRTTLPFRRNNVAMRQYLLRRYGLRNHWVLGVDVDEFFDYPRSDSVSIASLLRYLRSRSFTAMVAYQLDMFSDRPLSEISADPTSLQARFKFYDISAVRKIGYFEEDGYGGEVLAGLNQLADDGVRRYLGGIRRQVFNLPEVYLIKHPLTLCDGKVRMAHQHFTRGANVADVTGVLYHYKFADGFVARVSAALESRSFADESWEYGRYKATLEEQSELRLRSATAMTLDGVDDLVKSGFLRVTAEYERLAAGPAPPDRDTQ